MEESEVSAIFELHSKPFIQVMPFSLNPKFIKETEQELGLIFPPLYKAKMIKENGGEAGTEDEGWTLFPFLITRTINE